MPNIAAGAGSRALAPPAAQPQAVAATWVLCAGLLALGAWFALTKVLDHDAGYWLDAAGRVLDGARLYRDLIDVNPPTNYVVTLVPAALARTLGTAAVPTFHAFVVAVALLATGMAALIARRLFADDAMLARFAAVPVLFATLIVPGADFGQREHLAGMLLIPYVMVAAGRGSPLLSRRLRLAAGVMAGVAVAFKPFFILYPLAVEATVLLRDRDLRALARAETVASVAIPLAAAAATAVIFPDYLGVLLPLAREVYHGFEVPLLAALLRADVIALALLAILALLRSRESAQPVRRLIILLVAAALAALAIYVIQRKGWRYQMLPALMFATMALGMTVAAAVAGYLRRVGQTGAVAALAGAALGCMALAGLIVHGWHASDRRYAEAIAPLVDLVAREAAGRPVLFLSSHMTPAFPVINYSGALWRYRYPHLMPLPGLYRGFDAAAAGRPFRAPAEMGPTEASFFATMIDGALRFPPRLILVDRRPQFPPLSDIGFDFLAYFGQDPRFAALLAHYRPAGRVAGQDVLVRADP